MKASRMKPLAGAILVALAAVAAPAIAQSAGTQATVVGAKAPGAGALGEVVTTSATITAIDRDKRVVTVEFASASKARRATAPRPGPSPAAWWRAASRSSPMSWR